MTLWKKIAIGTGVVTLFTIGCSPRQISSRCSRVRPHIRRNVGKKDIVHRHGKHRAGYGKRALYPAKK